LSKAFSKNAAADVRLRLLALIVLGLMLITAGFKEAHLGIRAAVMRYPIARMAQKKITDLEVWLEIIDPNDKPNFIYEGIHVNGVQLYKVAWQFLGSHPFAVRVLTPNNPSASYSHSFLFVLPVEPGLAQSTYGSGLDELQKLNVQNRYNATIIEPMLPNLSWYADNPTDPTMDYETFTGMLLPEWVDRNLARSGTEPNLLIGFSKSGYGALDLLLKHPSVFSAAAAWDFPVDMTSYDEYGADENSMAPGRTSKTTIG
jgi:Putative esterase